MASLFNEFAASKSGQVAQPDLGASLHSGIQLAQAHQAHLLNVERVKQDRETLELKKAGWLAGKLTQGASIVNKAARAQYFKNLGTQCQQAQVAFDPAVIPILVSDEGAAAIQKIELHSAGLDQNRQNSLALDLLHSVGDAPGAESWLHHNAELAGNAARAQAASGKAAREQSIEQAKLFDTAKAGVATQNKENIERIHYANQILETVTDPEARKDPYAAASTVSGLAKSLFPGGVIRESEITFLDHINPGMGQKIKGWLQGQLGEGKVTDDMFFAIGKLAQKTGGRAQFEIDKQKVALQKNLPPGMSADDIYSVVPKANLEDIRPSFPGKFPEFAAKPAVPAGGGAAPEAPTPEIAAKANLFNKYQQKYGLTPEAIKAGVGMSLKAPGPIPNAPQVAAEPPASDNAPTEESP